MTVLAVLKGSETEDLQKLVNYNFIMPDRDKTYSTNQVKKISECHISNGKNNQLAAPKLNRWADLNRAIIDWWNNDATEETSVRISEQNNFQFYDPIQKKILSDLFKRFRELYPKKNIDFEFEYITKEAIKEINGEEYGITTHFTYEFADSDYSEYIRLKTAHDPEPALIDRAIISKFQSENEDFITAALSKDDLIEIDIIENPDEIIDKHFEILENYINNKQKRTPGNHCNFCNMSSTCGQFPLVSEGKVNNRVRQLKVSKTNLVKLNNCERRAAWNVQYGLPREDYLEFETESDATKFHKYSQKLLVNSKENLDLNNIDNFHEVASDEDQVTRHNLFKKYQGLISELQEYSNLEIKDSEYQLGFTCIADGVDLKNGKAVDKKVATVFMGKADLVGRVDGVPLIIELKTRPEIPEDLLESQLYALGASKLLKVDEVIVLHIYSLDDKTTSKERRYEESELASIKLKFEDIAIKTGSWLPYNALSPKYNVGDWCSFCEFKNTCLENRVSEGQQEVISLEKIVSKEKETLIKEQKELEEKRNTKIDEISMLENLEQEKVKELKIRKTELIKIEEMISERINEDYAIKEKKRLLKEQQEINKETEIKKVENERIKKELQDIEEDMRTKEAMLNSIDNRLNPILVISNLINDLLTNFIKKLLIDAGYGSNEQVKKLDNDLSREVLTWISFRGKMPANPFTDVRYLIKLIEFSIDHYSLVPKLNHLKDRKVEFNNLRDALNYEYHNNINPNEVRVVKLGEAILKVMNTVLTSKKYSGQTESDLKDFITKTNSLLKPFKNSLTRNSKN